MATKALDTSYKGIIKKSEKWQSLYSNNNDRGASTIAFTTSNQQWSSGITGRRADKGKETLVLNNAIKYENRAKNQLRQIDFNMEIAPMHSGYAVEAYNAFKLFIKHVFNSGEQQRKYYEMGAKAISYGYSVAQVRFDREDNKTLNLIPKVKVLDNPSVAFFDPQAESSTKIDGKYCGIHLRGVPKETIKLLYPDAACLDDNELIDYWYRVREKAVFVELTTGVKKNVDFLTDAEEDMQLRDKLGLPVTCNEWVDKIFYCRYVNKEKVEGPEEYPTDDLPLVYDPSLTFWTPGGYETYPYTYYLRDAQRLHNLVASQLATILKNATASKWFFRPNHIQNETQKDEFKKINELEGGFMIGEDTVMPVPHKVAPDELPQSMLAFTAQTAQEMEAISGAMMELQPSDNVVVSGEAIKQISHNIQIMNSGLIATHVDVINDICKLQKQMMVRICLEERLLCLKDDAGRMQSIVINKRTDTDLIINDIRTIENDFYYEVKAGPNTAMQKENALKSLETIYQFYPQAAQLTADIFARSLDTPDSEEIARRLQAGMDQDLISYGAGQMTYDEFKKNKMQQAQQAQQMQMQMMQAQQAPQVAAMQKAADAEMKKAEADVMDAANKSDEIAINAEAQAKKANLDTYRAVNAVAIDRERMSADTLKENDETMRETLRAILTNEGVDNASR